MKVRMPNLTKRDLVIRISNETGIVQQNVLNIIQRTLDYLVESLSQGHAVELRNFGVFEVKLRKARVGEILTAPNMTCRFRPALWSSSRWARK